MLTFSIDKVHTMYIRLFRKLNSRKWQKKFDLNNSSQKLLQILFFSIIKMKTSGLKLVKTFIYVNYFSTKRKQNFDMDRADNVQEKSRPRKKKIDTLKRFLLLLLKNVMSANIFA